MAPVIRELRSRPTEFEVSVCVTGQHREMLDQALQIFSVQPDFDLDVMTPDQSLSELAGKVMASLRRVLDSAKPDVVLVHGDTSSAVASSLAAFYEGYSVGHVEAGLRTDSKRLPFPEELNRRLISQIADWHFAPTERAQENLLRDGIEASKILVTGNTVIDALKWILDDVDSDNDAKNRLSASLEGKLGFDFRASRVVLITGHRRENFGKGFEEICSAIAQLASQNPETAFVYPVHLNPNVRNAVQSLLTHRDNVCLLGPLDYLEFSLLLRHSYLVLTDSGGIQEEAPSLGKPVVVMRSSTERPEAVEAGTAMLVGSESEKIVAAVQALLDHPEEYAAMAAAKNPFGDGNASRRIADFLHGQEPNFGPN